MKKCYPLHHLRYSWKSGAVAGMYYKRQDGTVVNTYYSHTVLMTQCAKQNAFDLNDFRGADGRIMPVYVNFV